MAGFIENDNAIGTPPDLATAEAWMNGEVIGTAMMMVLALVVLGATLRYAWTVYRQNNPAQSEELSLR